MRKKETKERERTPQRVNAKRSGSRNLDGELRTPSPVPRKVRATNIKDTNEDLLGSVSVSYREKKGQSGEPFIEYPQKDLDQKKQHALNPGKISRSRDSVKSQKGGGRPYHPFVH